MPRVSITSWIACNESVISSILSRLKTLWELSLFKIRKKTTSINEISVKKELPSQYGRASHYRLYCLYIVSVHLQSWLSLFSVFAAVRSTIRIHKWSMLSTLSPLYTFFLCFLSLNCPFSQAQMRFCLQGNCMATQFRLPFCKPYLWFPAHHMLYWSL